MSSEMNRNDFITYFKGLLLRVIGTLLMIWGVVVLWDVRLGDYFYRNFEEPGTVILVGVVILLVGIVLHLYETPISPTSGVPTQEIQDGP